MAYGPNAHICDPLNIFQIGMVMMVCRSEKKMCISETCFRLSLYKANHNYMCHIICEQKDF